MAIIINNKITNNDVSIKSNLADGLKESSKLFNTLIGAVNLATTAAISELMDIEYNPNNGLIRPTTQSK